MRPNSNSDGVVLDYQTEFSAYDRLPKDVRLALANAPIKLCAHALKQKRWDKQRMLEGIEKAISNPVNQT
jgi:hypothetical protein